MTDTLAVTGPAEVRAQRRLDELEDVIQGGLQTFVEVGQALLEIRESRLYRFGYATVEDYYRGRWGFTDRHARRLIEATEVAREIGPIGPIANEAQARELAPLLREQGPAAVREVWATVIERAERHDEPVTGPVIRNAVREYVRSQGDLAESEMREAAAWMGDDDRKALSPELSRQRGELTRLVTDLSSLPPPADFLDTHGEYVLPRTVERAEVAAAWLSNFLTEWRGRHAG